MSDFINKQARLSAVKQNMHLPLRSEGGLPYFGKDVAGCTTVISNVEQEVDERVKNDMTASQKINWCRTIHPLYPLKTPGRIGFLTALSLALWSITHAGGIMCQLLFVFFAQHGRNHLLERLQQRSEESPQVVESNFNKYTEMSRGRSEGENGVSSEGDNDIEPTPLHIFAMANILRRPIVIVGDEDDEHTGLYLPVLWKSEDCIKWPVVLAHHNGSFIPLLQQQTPNSESKLAEHAVPLVSSNLEPIKMQFLLEAEEKDAHSLLQNCLNVVDLNLTRSDDICLILSAKLNSVPLKVDNIAVSSASEATGGSHIDEQLELNLFSPSENVALPSAPNASIVTFNNLSEVHEEEPREISMLQETCVYPGCHLFASKFTEPYCWEHVEQREMVQNRNQPTRTTEEHVDVSMVNERCREPRCQNYASRFVYPYCYEHLDRRTVECMTKKPRLNQTPPESSIVMERCQHGSCQNYASQYIYPFCYEHIDDREFGARPVAQSSQYKTQDFDVSIMAETCIQPNCHNRASIYTFPVCYEHLDSPLAKSRAVAATRVVHVQRPAEKTRRVVKGVPPQASQSATPKVLPIDKKFEETMKELEARSKNSVAGCLNTGCTNFGNSKCRGYCHSCFNALRT